MKSIFDILDEISHQLNAPLASAKSYTYLSKRGIEKGETKKALEYLDSLDSKIDVLAARIDLVLTAVKLERASSAPSYHLFDISEVTDTDTCHADIIADRELLATALKYARELTGTNACLVTGQDNHVNITFPYSKRPESKDKDIRAEFSEKAIILHHTIRIHEGSVEDTERELKITLPLKPSAAK